MLSRADFGRTASPLCLRQYLATPQIRNPKFVSVGPCADALSANQPLRLWALVVKNELWESLLPVVDRGSRFPRIIHQTYPGASLPEALRDNVADLIAANPGWDHRLYDDRAIEQFISGHYPAEILAAYLRIRPEYGAARADLFRYLVIYRLGGVYLDIKSRFTRPIAEIVGGDEQIILSQWRNGAGQAHQGFGLHRELAHIAGGEFQQWHIIAAPGHPFLRAVILAVLSNIEHYSPWSFGVGRIGVFRLTGPIAYTLAIHPLLGTAPARVVSDEGELSLEYSITGDYVHKDAFQRHYSQYDTTILTLPLAAHWLGLAYTWAKRLKDRIGSARANP